MGINAAASSYKCKDELFEQYKGKLKGESIRMQKSLDNYIIR